MAKAKAEFIRPRIARMLGVSDGRVTQLVTENIIPAPKGREFDVDEVVRRYIKFKFDRPEVSNKDDKARKAKAEANIAEKKDSEMDRRLMDRDQMDSELRDALTTGAVNIGRMKELTSEQKEAVLAVLRDVKLPPLPPLVPEDETEDEDDDSLPED
jgi:hypothetical protein